MVENHTRDLLQMKAKETQLARSRNDAELTQAALSKAQRDLEALKQSSSSETSKELEIWKGRAEKTEQRLLEREQLDQNVLSRLTDLEEFIRGLDDDTPNSQVVIDLNSRCKDLEEQNRRLLTQLDDYSSRITTLEDVRLPIPSAFLVMCPDEMLTCLGFETSNDFTFTKWKFIFFTIIYIIWLRRREREFIWKER
jgi:hypothetical protein